MGYLPRYSVLLSRVLIASDPSAWIELPGENLLQVVRVNNSGFFTLGGERSPSHLGD